MAGSSTQYTPLTDYLIELCHDLDKLRDFWDNPKRALRGARLRPKHRRLLSEGNLEELLRAVRAEHSTHTYFALWVMRPINSPIPPPPPAPRPKPQK
jgi:hypothetical protein